jgi:hypothetical protein
MSMTSDTLPRVEAGEHPPARPGRGKRVVAGLILAVIAGGIVTGILIAVRGGDDEAKTALPTRPKPLDPAARELIALMTKGQQGTYHARYRTISPNEPGATLTIEIWRKGSQTRQESVASDGTRTVRTAAFHLDTGDLACRRIDAEAWKCSPVKSGITAPEQIISVATAELSGRSVTARDETIDGERVRCFTIVGEGQSSELCLTSVGIAVRVAAGPASLELVSLSDRVDGGVFRPPA